MNNSSRKTWSVYTLVFVLIIATVVMLVDGAAVLDLKPFSYYITHPDLYWGFGIIAFLFILIWVIKLNFFNSFGKH